MGQAARSRHHRRSHDADGVHDAPIERPEQISRLLRAGCLPSCCHRVEPIELARRRDRSGDRATAPEEIAPDETALLRLLQRWRDEASRSGRTITRIAAAFEAGRDGFWLARWLTGHGV